MTFFKTSHLQSCGAIAWGKNDALELDPTAMYLDLTGRASKTCTRDRGPSWLNELNKGAKENRSRDPRG